MEYTYSQYVISKKIQEVIPQVRTYTRYGTWSVVMFDYAESPFEMFSAGDYSLRFVREFRTDRLTRLVPAPVRFVLRND